MSNTQTTITVNNAAGLAETSGPAAAMLIGQTQSLLGGAGSGPDLTPMLVLASGSALQAWTIDQWAFPRSEVEGAAILLGSPTAGGIDPASPFLQGDGTLVLSIEYLQVQL